MPLAGFPALFRLNEMMGVMRLFSRWDKIKDAINLAFTPGKKRLPGMRVDEKS
jgi:hypothetical protein